MLRHAWAARVSAGCRLCQKQFEMVQSDYAVSFAVCFTVEKLQLLLLLI
jgi:hypothetical protein